MKAFTFTSLLFIASVFITSCFSAPVTTFAVLVAIWAIFTIGLFIGWGIAARRTH